MDTTSTLRKIKERVLKGVRLSKRERIILSKKIGCSEEELTKFLKRRHVWPYAFSPMADFFEILKSGIYAEKATPRGMVQR